MNGWWVLLAVMVAFTVWQLGRCAELDAELKARMLARRDAARRDAAFAARREPDSVPNRKD